MIQDKIENLIPRIEREIKKLFYITNEDYAGLLTDQGRLLGLPVDQNTFSIKFKYSSPQELLIRSKIQCFESKSQLCLFL